MIAALAYYYVSLYLMLLNCLWANLLYAGTTSKLRTVVVESEFHLAAKVLAPLWLLQQWWQLFFIFLLFLFLFIIL